MMVRFSQPVKCVKCGHPCWTSKQLVKFHKCIPEAKKPAGRLATTTDNR